MALRSSSAPAVVRPEGPSGLQSLVRLTSGRAQPHAFFTDVVRAHPRIAHLRLGPEHLYVLGHPDVVWQVFVTDGRFLMKGQALQRAKQLLGEGLLTSEGELWRRQRRLIQPAFHHERVRGYAEVMVSTALDQAQGWRAGDQVDMAREMSALTLRVVGRALFGSDLTGDAGRVFESLGEVVTGFQRQMAPGAALLGRLPTAGNRRLLAAGQQLDDLVRRLVADHRSHPGGDDLLSMMVAAQEDGIGMTDEQLRDETMTLVLAGHETTAMALTWTWYLLATNPPEAARLRAELDDVLGGRAPTYDDLPQLAFTRAVFAESMRLYPPAWTIGRRLLRDLEVDGWTLPEGSLAIASQWVLHRDPRFWPSALAFRPRRWLDATGRFDEGAPAVPRGAWFPFGLGARVCVGEPFAWAEGVLILAALAQSWAPRHVSGHPVDVTPAVTLRPRHGMRMTLEPREVRSGADGQSPSQ